MPRKILWLGSLVAVGLGGALTTKLVTGAPPPAAPTAEINELTHRLARLEHERAATGRAFARNVMELNTAAPEEGLAAPEPAAEQEAEAKRAASFAEREGHHFAQLDRQSRTGNGAAALAQMQNNLQALRSLPAAKRVQLDVASLECGDKLCRLELARAPAAGMQRFVPALLRGMGGNLSMRPAGDGRPVFYVSAAGQQIPPVAP